MEPSIVLSKESTMTQHATANLSRLTKKPRRPKVARAEVRVTRNEYFKNPAKYRKQMDQGKAIIVTDHGRVLMVKLAGTGFSPKEQAKLRRQVEIELSIA